MPAATRVLEGTSNETSGFEVSERGNCFSSGQEGEAIIIPTHRPNGDLIRHIYALWIEFPA